jgi:hypothetical protein
MKNILFLVLLIALWGSVSAQTGARESAIEQAQSLKVGDEILIGQIKEGAFFYYITKPGRRLVYDVDNISLKRFEIRSLSAPPNEADWFKPQAHQVVTVCERRINWRGKKKWCNRNTYYIDVVNAFMEGEAKKWTAPVFK